ncbi:hypothetical protein M747DRAFT_363558 [Aspergillus niger ATCC 13496]|uniref:Uncharacterized protein n=1 Tax=Aspergillus niger ATCC 13496 TaxID=1353008 RepID=A0A370BL97_ASPNG|nr:hypothetical protein M747DRAFT_363558 [Aspergillus niger ATCC 13496]
MYRILLYRQFKSSYVDVQPINVTSYTLQWAYSFISIKKPTFSTRRLKIQSGNEPGLVVQQDKLVPAKSIRGLGCGKRAGRSSPMPSSLLRPHILILHDHVNQSICIMSNPGNENRRIERDNCREALSKHILRLQPSPSDGYKWSYKESKSHLFKKPLSELSTNSYIELREALKEGAIKATRTHNESPDTEWRKLKADLDGACNRVAELEGENQQLYQALQRQSEKLRCLQRCFAENKGQLESALFIMETVKKAFDSDTDSKRVKAPFETLAKCAPKNQILYEYICISYIKGCTVATAFAFHVGEHREALSNPNHMKRYSDYDAGDLEYQDGRRI